MDHILLNQIPLDIMIGGDPEEMAAPQRIIVSLDIGITPLIMKGAAKTDQLTDAVDFKPLVDMIRKIGAERHRILLETLAEEIAAAALNEFPIEQVIVTVQKPRRYGTLDGIAVQIKRDSNKCDSGRN